MFSQSRGAVKFNSRINNLLDKLRLKLSNFVVKDLNGKTVGQVKTLTLDKHRNLTLVIVPSESQRGSQPVLLSSKFIQKVDTQNKVLIVDFDEAELEARPEYEQLQGSSSEYTATSQTSATREIEENSEESDALDLVESSETREVAEEEIIRLLEERLVVDRSKRKVGDVVVRKEIETRLVQVPVQREKLIVEQVSPEYRQLAEIDLGQGEVTGVEVADSIAAQITSTEAQPTVKGEFFSPKTASMLLDAIALQKPHGCAKVRIEIVLDDPQLQDTYQQMFDRCTGE